MIAGTFLSASVCFVLMVAFTTLDVLDILEKLQVVDVANIENESFFLSSLPQYVHMYVMLVSTCIELGVPSNNIAQGYKVLQTFCREFDNSLNTTHIGTFNHLCCDICKKMENSGQEPPLWLSEHRLRNDLFEFHINMLTKQGRMQTKQGRMQTKPRRSRSKSGKRRKTK